MTNNKQQTAVGLIYEAFTKSGRSGFTEWLWENKNSLEEIERNTIAKAFDDGDYNYYCSIQTGNDLDDGQEHYQEFNDGQDYYNETYRGGEQ